MQRFIFTLSAVVLLLGGVLNTASADGGLQLQTTAEPVLTKAVADDQLQLLQELVRVTSYLQALQLGIPEPAYDDEGLLTVAVSETMRFSCDGKGGQTGDWCVRHLGDVGESYVDLNLITGFPYDDRLAYTLTVMKTRSATYGIAGQPQYDYVLVQIDDVKQQ